MSTHLSRIDLEWVKVGSMQVERGDYMRRYLAEAEELDHRDCSEEELAIIEELES